MNRRLLVPILLIIMMLSVMVAPGRVSAANNTNVNDTKVIPTYIEIYDHVPPYFHSGVDQLTLHKNRKCCFFVCLYTNGSFGGSPLPMRYINYKLLDSNMTLIKTERNMPSRVSIFELLIAAPIIFDLGDLKVGEYLIELSYDGNKRDHLAPSVKRIPAHIVD